SDGSKDHAAISAAGITTPAVGTDAGVGAIIARRLLARTHGVAVVPDVGRHGGVANAKGVSVGGIPRRNVANRCLLLVPRIAGLKRDVRRDGRVILKTIGAELGAALVDPSWHRATHQRRGEHRGRDG